MHLQNCANSQMLKKRTISLKRKTRTIEAILNNSKVDHREITVLSFSMPRITHRSSKFLSAINVTSNKH